MDLTRIYQKLLADPKNKTYCTNNVICGLNNALKHKNIKTNKLLCKELKALLLELRQLEIPTSYKSINESHIIKACRIGWNAKAIIEEAME